jgi:hypothetical protein
MRQLLENVGASEQQITRILATAKDNAQRGVFGGGPIAPNPGGTAFSAGPGGGGVAVAEPPGGPSGGGAGEPGAGRQRGERGGAAGGQGRGGFGGRNLSPEQREQMQKAMQQALGGRDISELSQEERRALFQKIRPQGAGGAGGAGGQGRGGGQAGPGGQRGGPTAEGAGSPAGGPEIPSLSLSRPGAQGFTAEDRAQAQLPAPPEEGSDVDILLRPGLLANAEIIVERIPDTLYVPFQGIFEVGAGHVVYVKTGNTFEPRKVEVGPRSESQIVITSGLEEGEQIALAPPFDDGRTEKKKTAQPAQPSFPGGGGGEAAPPAGGGRRRR